MVTEKYILKIQVNRVPQLEEGNYINVVNLLTKSEAKHRPCGWADSLRDVGGVKSKLLQQAEMCARQNDISSSAVRLG